MLMLPYTRLFGIECRKDTLLATGVMMITMVICCMALINRSRENNVLTRRDLVETITTVVHENSKLSTDLAAHVDKVVQNQTDQEDRVKKLLDQEQLNEIRMQEIAEAILKKKVSTTTLPKVND